MDEEKSKAAFRAFVEAGCGVAAALEQGTFASGALFKESLDETLIHGGKRSDLRAAMGL